MDPGTVSGICESDLPWAFVVNVSVAGQLATSFRRRFSGGIGGNASASGTRGSRRGTVWLCSEARTRIDGAADRWQQLHADFVSTFRRPLHVIDLNRPFRAAQESTHLIEMKWPRNRAAPKTTV